MQNPLFIATNDNHGSAAFAGPAADAAAPVDDAAPDEGVGDG